jgi:putative tricarboxylic transport membrane protein
MNPGNEKPIKRASLIGNPRDFFGACGLLLLALFVLWATRDLPGQQGFQLGAGSVPRLFALLLAANALFVMTMSAFGRGPTVQYAIRPALAVASLGAVGLTVLYFSGPVLAVVALTAAAFLFLKQLSALEIRGPVFVAVAILSFAAFIKPLGLFLTVFSLVSISSAASKEYRIIESLIWAVALAAFSILLFTLLLNLPISAFPPALFA